MMSYGSTIPEFDTVHNLTHHRSSSSTGVKCSVIISNSSFGKQSNPESEITVLKGRTLDMVNALLIIVQMY